MEVHIEVERAAEPLHEGDRTRARRERSGATALVGEDRTQRDLEAARDEHRVAGEQEPRPARQRQDPLTHRYLRNHAVYEVRGGVVPELDDPRMALERGLHDAALDAPGAGSIELTVLRGSDERALTVELGESR